MLRTMHGPIAVQRGRDHPRLRHRSAEASHGPRPPDAWRPAPARLQVIGDEAWDIVIHANNDFPDRLIERLRSGERLLAGVRCTRDLDQENEIRRVEGVSDDDAWRLRAFGLEIGDGEAGGGRGDDCIGRNPEARSRLELLLQVQPLGSTLLHEICRSHRLRLRRRLSPAQIAAIRGTCANALLGRPDSLEEFIEAVFGDRRRIPHDHVERRARESTPRTRRQ